MASSEPSRKIRFNYEAAYRAALEDNMNSIYASTTRTKGHLDNQQGKIRFYKPIDISYLHQTLPGEDYFLMTGIEFMSRTRNLFEVFLQVLSYIHHLESI